MSADLISSMVIKDRPAFNSEREYYEAGADDESPPRGVANTKGQMIIDLHPGYRVKITSQSNAAYTQYCKVMDYANGSFVTFKGAGEGKSMKYNNTMDELDMGTSSEWRSISLQFGYKVDNGKLLVPRIRNAHVETVGKDVKVTVTSEDSTDMDFNDTILTVKMLG